MLTFLHRTFFPSASRRIARPAFRRMLGLGVGAVGLLAGMMVLDSCVQPPEYPIEPVLEFRSISNTTLQEVGGDTLYLVFGFTDGDGDLGFSDTVNSVFVEDTRFPGFPLSYFIKEVVPLSNVQAISGTMSILYPPGFFGCLAEEPTDTFRLEVQIKDRAGHLSNLVSTPVLTVECE